MMPAGINITDKTSQQSKPLLHKSTKNSKQRALFTAYMKDIIQLDLNETNVSELIYESKYRKVCRKLVKGGAIIFGATAGSPYFSMALAAGENYFPLGYFAGTATLIAYGGATIWVMHTLTDKLTPTAIAESQISATKISPIYKHILCNSLGILTSLSTIYVTSRYTSSSLLIGMAFLTELGYKTQGYYHLLEIFQGIYKSHHKKVGRAEDRNVILTKQNYAKIIKEITTPDLLQNPAKIKQLFVWNNEMTDKENIQEFFANIVFHANDLLATGLYTKKHDHIKKVFQKIAFFIPLCNLLTSFYFNSKTAAVVWENPFFTYPAATLLAAPHFALDILGTSGSTGQIVDITLGKYTGGMYVSRKANLSMFLFSCVLSILSAYVDGFVVYDNLSQDSNPFFYKLALFLAIVLIVANTLFEGFTSSVTYNNFLKIKAGFSSDETVKEKAVVVKKLSSLSTSISSLRQGFFHQATKVQKISEESLKDMHLALGP